MNEASGGQLPDYTGTISWAVKCMENGHRVRRTGWNGKGMYLYMPLRKEDEDIERPYVVIKPPYGADGYESGGVVPWVCSQTDLLATDWEVVR